MKTKTQWQLFKAPAVKPNQIIEQDTVQVTDTQFSDTQQLTLLYNPEVEQALKKYNCSINAALEAVQKLEAIAVTARLSKMFWVQEQEAAQMIQQDYLVAA